MNQPITSAYKLVKLCGFALRFTLHPEKLLAALCAFKQRTHVSAPDALGLQNGF